MKNVAILLRALQFYAHSAHNLAKGSTFFEDHEFFGELYPAYESDYDSVVERMIGLEGLNGDADVCDILKKACEIATEKNCQPSETAFATILATEKNLCREIDSAMMGASNGTQNLLQDIADRSEQRQYKLARKLSP